MLHATASRIHPPDTLSVSHIHCNRYFVPSQPEGMKLNGEETSNR